MSAFFASARPGKIVTHGTAEFELPALYFRDDAFALFYTVNPQRVKEVLPSDKLHPVLLPGKKALAGIAAFNYIDTSIGPYGEVGIIVPVVYGPKPPPMLLPAILESRYPGFGALVLHLPVTNALARDAGRGEWGYTKFIADMHFSITPEFLRCSLREGNRHILIMQVGRAGLVLRDKKPLVTYSVLNGNLIKTTIPQTGSYRQAIVPQDAHVEWGNHQVADSFRRLQPSVRPLFSRYYLERHAILPAGKIIEKKVRPLEGYLGQNQEGLHRTDYLDVS